MTPLVKQFQRMERVFYKKKLRCSFGEGLTRTFAESKQLIRARLQPQEYYKTAVSRLAFRQWPLNETRYQGLPKRFALRNPKILNYIQNTVTYIK